MRAQVGVGPPEPTWPGPRPPRPAPGGGAVAPLPAGRLTAHRGSPSPGCDAGTKGLPRRAGARPGLRASPCVILTAVRRVLRTRGGTRVRLPRARRAHSHPAPGNGSARVSAPAVHAVARGADCCPCLLPVLCPWGGAPRRGSPPGPPCSPRSISTSCLSSPLCISCGPRDVGGQAPLSPWPVVSPSAGAKAPRALCVPVCVCCGVTEWNQEAVCGPCMPGPPACVY